MTAQTRAFLTQVIKSDPTVSAAESKAFAMFIDGAYNAEHGGGVVQRVVSREDAAKILGLGVKRVDDFTRRGALRRVYLPGNKRASGILMASIDAVISQGVR